MTSRSIIDWNKFLIKVNVILTLLSNKYIYIHTYILNYAKFSCTRDVCDILIDTSDLKKKIQKIKKYRMLRALLASLTMMV